jgi:hypothetical protein
VYGRASFALLASAYSSPARQSNQYEIWARTEDFSLPDMVTTERVICWQCCDDPLSPPPENGIRFLVI